MLKRVQKNHRYNLNTLHCPRPIESYSLAILVDDEELLPMPSGYYVQTMMSPLEMVHEEVGDLLFIFEGKNAFLCEIVIEK